MRAGMPSNLTKSIFLIALTAPINWAMSVSAAESLPKALSLKLGYFNGPAATCSSATPCQPVKPEIEQEYYSYLNEGFKALKSCSDSGKSAEAVQKATFDYYDGVTARDKLFGPCYGRCTNYDQPEMLWHATTDTARNEKLNALIDLRYVYYGAGTVLKQGMDVTKQIEDGLKRYRR
jgi:hypothetical protein